MMRRIFQIIAWFFIACLIAGICLGDTIVLKRKDKKTKQPIKIEGKILKTDKDKVTIETSPGETRTIPRKQIRRIIKGKPPWEIYEQKKQKIKDTAQAHYKLGQWCNEHGLKEEAEQEWSRAIELDPDYKKARKALGYLKDNNGNWRLEKEVMIEKGMARFEGSWVSRDKFEKLMKEGKYAFTLKAAIEEDVDEKFLKEFGERIKATSAYLWKGTRGQFYIAEITITDKSSRGNVIVPKGHVNSDWRARVARASFGGKGRIGTMTLPGKVDVYTFLHEIGHAAFGLPDESNPVCRVCVMRGAQLSGDWRQDPRFCDPSNHTAAGASCWERILAQWPNLVGLDNDPCGEVPETKVKIVNK